MRESLLLQALSATICSQALIKTVATLRGKGSKVRRELGELGKLGCGGQAEKRTRGQGDKETRRQGDNYEFNIHPSTFSLQPSAFPLLLTPCPE